MTEAQSRELAKKLPSKWLSRTIELLAERGRHFSAGHISRVKNAHNQNDVIEEVLLEVAAEESRRCAELDQRIAEI